MEAFRLTMSCKIPAVTEFIGDLVDQFAEQTALDERNLNKALIFFHHDEMLKALEELMEKKKASYFVISGATSSEKRDLYKNEFQTTEKYQYGLLSIMAAGVGLTLTAATTEIFTEVMFDPSVFLQAEDRAHRQGQTKVVNIFYLICPKTTDEINYGLICKKERESSTMIDGKESHISAKRLTAEKAINRLKGEEENCKKPEQEPIIVYKRKKVAQ
jgi:SWI/SNF-related matrix-associated actin-dependent regulator 1 of chromatin subfamily A